MAEIGIKIETEAIEDLRTLAKEKGLNQSRLIIAAIRVGTINKKKLLEEYLNVK